MTAVRFEGGQELEGIAITTKTRDQIQTQVEEAISAAAAPEGRTGDKPADLLEELDSSPGVIPVDDGSILGSFRLEPVFALSLLLLDPDRDVAAASCAWAITLPSTRVESRHPGL
ncbi:hypothetical protein N7452_005755 [Penicillium brevicompactum]|uniref:Uncharacterized protein n=1 Tax=Penicillium brevicompactum TaxID=5074 RepID=A0A9W9QJD5_PENBR|nr:hypothetical protein N7452_005755 [Penicillium brevicompactum]